MGSPASDAHSEQSLTEETVMAAVTMKTVMDFFGKKGSLKDFTDEWKALTEKDKDQIKGGLENGTLTY